MEKLERIYASDLEKYKTPEGRHNFLKYAYRYLLPGEFSFMMDDNYKITKITICPLKQKVKENGKYRVVSIFCSKLLFPKTSIASIGESLNKQFNTQEYSKGELLLRDEKYQSLDALLADKDMIKYLSQDTKILSCYEEEVSKIIPRFKLGMTAAKTSYDELMRFIGKERAAQFKFRVASLNPKTGYLMYYKNKKRRQYTARQVGLMIISKILPTKWLYDMYDGVVP
jgi:hypothetical protein